MHLLERSCPHADGGMKQNKDICGETCAEACAGGECYECNTWGVLPSCKDATGKSRGCKHTSERSCSKTCTTNSCCCYTPSKRSISSKGVQVGFPDICSRN